MTAPLPPPPPLSLRFEGKKSSGIVGRPGVRAGVRIWLGLGLELGTGLRLRLGIGTPLKTSELFGRSPTPVNDPQCPCHERHAALEASASERHGKATSGCGGELGAGSTPASRPCGKRCSKATASA